MKIKALTVIIISSVIVIAGVILTNLLGVWSTVSTKTPQKYQESSLSNQYNPADIRGSYTFSEISRLFQIPSDDLAAAFSIDSKAADTFQCKSLEELYANAPHEIGTGSVRMFTAFYLGLPFDLTEETYLPLQAAQILKDKEKMTTEQASYLDTHTVSFTVT